jgi:hypothetical protein
MTLEQAIEARKLKREPDGSYPWLVLPCRILSDGRRNYVIVYNTQKDDLDDMDWEDLNLKRGDHIPPTVHNFGWYCSQWKSLVAKCKDSNYWQAWTLSELYYFNCQDLINDPDVPRGLITNDKELYGV